MLNNNCSIIGTQRTTGSIFMKPNILPAIMAKYHTVISKLSGI
ncbi:hypothetical protein SP22_70 [Salmonella phage 22]|uniref:Uncharacterized protein n=1 Tax=Salmonella phage 22 TaxID=1654885 RepID=A0A0N7CEV4_BPP22|nr:hypothetical protein SP22_70 [Salmonella phage 22]